MINSKKILLFLCFGFLLFLFGCAGDSAGGDHTPPIKPLLIPHIGNLGDKDQNNNWVSGFDEQKLSDENNGIDAVDDADWIRLMWYPLKDHDLDYLRVYRFYEDYSGIQGLTLIDSVSGNLNLNNSYTDRSLDQGSIPAVDKTWYYFIELFDTSGNSSVSDTVGYHLLRKPVILSPENNGYIHNGEDLVFKWTIVPNVTIYRLIIFNEDMLYVWHYDFPFSFEDFPEVNFSNTESPLLPGTYYCRVDALTEDVNPASGSESNLIRFIIQ
ncbi:MAG: hypothetical protein CSB55_01335 [Candidatus Cloacimonadota bacterium]|nr:MAG: hypothetical protein CSB55_01335 [Candidatus Cloacimonadota bacterium]